MMLGDKGDARRTCISARPAVSLGMTRVMLGEVVTMWIVVSWLSVKDGNVVVVKAARHGRSTWGGCPIGGADSSLDMQPRLEVLFSDDVSRHREVSRASSNSKASPWATKLRNSDCPRRGTND